MFQQCGCFRFICSLPFTKISVYFKLVLSLVETFIREAVKLFFIVQMNLPSATSPNHSTHICCFSVKYTYLFITSVQTFFGPLFPTGTQGTPCPSCWCDCTFSLLLYCEIYFYICVATMHIFTITHIFSIIPVIMCSIIQRN